MQFELPFSPRRPRSTYEAWLQVGARLVRLWLVANPRARRYVLRLRPDGTARVAIPRGGSAAEAQRFAERHIPWLEQQLLRLAARPARPAAWLLGAEILFRGEPVRLQAGTDGHLGAVCFGNENVRVKDPAADLRPELERYLWQLAVQELSARALELAALHRVAVQRVTVRNQRSRWGSCSRRGTVSLNWRLVQTPPLVRDYIILHELAHFKEMNHSRRFWAEVARLCPEFGQAEGWLKAHPELLSR
ncbi:MAG TPA: SprT family zinc-dependent metalloprotease [Bacillota bacterium]|nr:SprT family zinc-dependent metalloprotease [Bacillota bacterium]